MNRSLLCSIGIVCSLVTHMARADESGSLMKWIPADANAIAIVDVESLLRTPLALRENLKQKLADAFVNHELTVPPDSKRVLFASQLGLENSMEPDWEVGVIELDKTPSFALIARREKGQLDSVSGQSAIRFDQGATIVELAPGIVLATSQPNRQVVSRWVTAAKKSPAQQVSSYLQKAAGEISPSRPLVLAMDLSETVTVSTARNYLASLKLFESNIAAQADTAELLATLKGATLLVQLTDARRMSLRFDFAKPTAELKSNATVLLKAVLDDIGAGIDEVDKWSVAASGSTLTFEGEITSAGLRRIVSLVAPGSGHRDLSAEESVSITAESTSTIVPTTSQKYFRSVKGLIDELRQTLNKTRDNHAVWMERYARKIDDLPIKDVDKDLLTFGGNVSGSFRYQAQAKRMAGVRSGVREAQPNYQTYGGYNSVGPFGTFGTYSWSTTVRVEPERGQIRTEENASATQVRVAEWKKIEDGLIQIRRVLTERYNVEF